MLLNAYQPGLVEAGIDEAGRGCYAGPVFAAAVILPPHFYHPLLNDSKQVSAANRNLLRPVIESSALAWAVAAVPASVIDQVNILQATFLAMHQCVDQLSITPNLLLVDGNRFKPYPFIMHHCVVKGDGTYTAIAAASILAKTHRDAHMQHLHQQYPQYGWNENKGYGTAAHRAAIAQYGLCPEHRKSSAI